MVRIGGEIRLSEDGPAFVLEGHFGEGTYGAVYRARRKSDVYSLGLVVHFLATGKDETAAQRTFFGYPHISVAFGEIGGTAKYG